MKTNKILIWINQPQTLFRNKFINNSKNGDKRPQDDQGWPVEDQIIENDSANDEIDIHLESNAHYDEIIIEEKELIEVDHTGSLSRKLGGITKEMIRKSEKAGNYAIGVANGVANGVIKLPVKTGYDFFQLILIFIFIFVSCSF